MARTGLAPMLRETLGGLTDRVLELDGKVERIQESASSYRDGGLASLALEDIGWAKPGAHAMNDELDVTVLKQHAVQGRALRGANPLVRRGLVVRCAYLFEDPIQYPDTGAMDKFLKDPVNKEAMFSEDAEDELESALVTDGNYFILVDRSRKQVRHIPFHQITGVAVDPEYQNEIMAYLWERPAVDPTSGEPPRRSYIPAITYRTASLPATIDDIPVEQTRRIEHCRVGRQSDWRYGVPDLFGAVYWAKAYREYLESVFTLNKALARLAFKATTSNQNRSRSARDKVAAELRRPTAAHEAGGTVALGAGQDLTAINKAGAGGDFAAGSPLAAMVSACLDIPLSVLLTDGSAGGRQGAENALEEPTIKSMNRRRRVHLESRRRVLEYLGLADPDEVTWAELDNFQVHRAMQSLIHGNNLGALHPEEIRQASLRYLKIQTSIPVDDIPEPPAPAEQLDPVRNNTEDVPVGPQSDGTNDSRDNPGGSTDA